MKTIRKFGKWEVWQDKQGLYGIDKEQNAYGTRNWVERQRITGHIGVQKRPHMWKERVNAVAKATGMPEAMRLYLIRLV